MDASTIDLHVSPRSPYSWLAAQRAESILEGLPVKLRWLHRYPRDLENLAMVNTPGNKRLGYTVTDVSRFATRYGLTFQLIAPSGFISDHMEVLYDLDTLARERADELGGNMRRVPTVGTEPRALGPMGPRPSVCALDCCPAPKRPPAPASPRGA